MTKKHVVTGALGYTGKYITERLLKSGSSVISLTGHPGRPNHFGDRVTTAPFNFDAPTSLTRTLEGVDTLYSTPIGYALRMETLTTTPPWRT
jgi:NADH dehydrogenase